MFFYVHVVTSPLACRWVQAAGGRQWSRAVWTWRSTPWSIQTHSILHETIIVKMATHFCYRWNWFHRSILNGTLIVKIATHFCCRWNRVHHCILQETIILKTTTHFCLNSSAKTAVMATFIPCGADRGPNRTSNISKICSLKYVYNKFLKLGLSTGIYSSQFNENLRLLAADYSQTWIFLWGMARVSLP